MAKNLVIVESPAKAQTISKFLSKDYVVRASFGHIRDLPKSKLGVDPENNFEPTYVVSKEARTQNAVKELKTLLKSAETVWIATDPDREGEAIGWHLTQALPIKKTQQIHRVAFHEITKEAILHALSDPQKINIDLVDAQQARRILDRIVGYELSPLLWQKIRYGLSAGRVQSVAVRLIVEREREIRAFVPVESWSITGQFSTKTGATFQAALSQIDHQKATLNSEPDTKPILAALKKLPTDGTVTDLVEKEKNRYPAPPFITSTLQQEASRKLGFSVKQTMAVAQQLYEGIDLADGRTGLITYMRTDSVNLAKSALDDIRKMIVTQYGQEYLPESTRGYKSKQSAQEAHEAIRPVQITLTPDHIQSLNVLRGDQLALYRLIWQRTIACQMAEAKIKQVSADIDVPEQAHIYTFHTTGQVITFPGFIKAYMEDFDAEDVDQMEGESILPPVVVNQKVQLEKLLPNQHFTKPPARYTESSLVKKLEQEGIGRPSTYAPTISTIVARGYVEKEGKTLIPTDTAEVVNDFLVKFFDPYINVHFTADMEQKLDQIAEGKANWVDIVRNYYKPLHQEISDKKEHIAKADVVSEQTDEICDVCGSPMVIKLSRFGKFLSCSRYPDCKNAKTIDGKVVENVNIGPDPATELMITLRNGRYGPYLQLGEDDKAAKTKAKKVSLAYGPKLVPVSANLHNPPTVEEALQLLSLPRTVGTDNGETVTASIGRFGPYIKKATEFRSIPKEYDLLTLTLDDALTILKMEKTGRRQGSQSLRELGISPETKKPVKIMEGRFGPYITDGSKVFASVPKGSSIEEITLEEAIELIQLKQGKPKKAGSKTTTKKKSKPKSKQSTTSKKKTK
ncbi:type I DNA topoisomerase [Candidatus Gracilibacteria bacterium]|nr:type I DNA topoisomerase [Candidatus Gracilibacteria bacterium]